MQLNKEFVEKEKYSCQEGKCDVISERTHSIFVHKKIKDFIIHTKKSSDKFTPLEYKGLTFA